jgi:hypothetical protein
MVVRETGAQLLLPSDILRSKEDILRPADPSTSSSFPLGFWKARNQRHPPPQLFLPTLHIQLQTRPPEHVQLFLSIGAVLVQHLWPGQLPGSSQIGQDICGGSLHETI